MKGEGERKMIISGPVAHQQQSTTDVMPTHGVNSGKGIHSPPEANQTQKSV